MAWLILHEDKWRVAWKGWWPPFCFSASGSPWHWKITVFWKLWNESWILPGFLLKKRRRTGLDGKTTVTERIVMMAVLLVCEKAFLNF